MMLITPDGKSSNTFYAKFLWQTFIYFFFFLLFWRSHECLTDGAQFFLALNDKLFLNRAQAEFFKMYKGHTTKYILQLDLYIFISFTHLKRNQYPNDFYILKVYNLSQIFPCLYNNILWIVLLLDSMMEDCFEYC